MNRVLPAILTLAFCLAALAQDGPGRAGLRYNQVRQKASHNSYAKKDGVYKQLMDWNIRVIEFDAHASSPGLLKRDPAPEGDFRVYHRTGDSFSNCNLLSECFGEVKRFHEAKPDHQVVTVFFDVEDLGAPGHGKDDFQGLIERSFPAGSVLRPSDLLEACPAAKDLQESVTAGECRWPLLEDLRGKFIFVISDGREEFRETGYDAATDLVFLVNKGGARGRKAEEKDAVFFNMSGPDPYALEVFEAGFVSRCYWLDKEKNYEKARHNRAHILAMDKLDPQAYPYTNTTQPDGFPFETIE